RQGDELYVVLGFPREATISSVQIGRRQPLEWNQWGRVSLACLDAPFHLAAVLGSSPTGVSNPSFGLLNSVGALATAGTNPIPSAVSQLVAVAESCAYDFSFWAVASDTDAVAEVFWRGGDCGLLQTDQVALAVEPQATPGAQPRLVFHQRRLTS